MIQKKKKRLSKLLVLVCLGSIGLFLLLRWANSPSSQSIPSGTPPEQQPIEAFQTITTDYFTTSVPGSSRVQQNPSADGRVQISVVGATGQDATLGITSDRLPPEGLAGVADYNVRITKPEDYNPITDDAFPPSMVLFQKVASPSEFVLFMTKGERYATLAVSGAATEPSKLLELLRTVYRAWQWL